MKLTFYVEDTVWDQALYLVEPGKDQDDVFLDAITMFIRVAAAKRLAILGRPVPGPFEVSGSASPTMSFDAAIGADGFWDIFGTETDATWAVAIAEGLPVSFFNALASSLRLKPRELGILTGTKPSAIRRWMRSGRLDMAEGDRVYGVAITLKACVKLFSGDIAAMLLWLKRPALVLNNRPPIYFFKTFVGMGLIKALIWQMENGVLS